MILTTIDSLYLACPMCMSGAAGKTVMAANTAVFVLMAVLVAVLASLASFMVYLTKRARRVAREMAAETEAN